MLTPEDSGTEQAPITYMAYQNETPVLSGGREISGWVESTVNGQRCWVADLSQVREGKWFFHQFWVNGERALQGKHPNEGLLSIESVPGADPKADVFKGQDRFVFAPGDFRALGEPRGRRCRRPPLLARRADGGPGSGRGRIAPSASFSPSRMRLLEGYGEGSPRARYYVENARELLDAPGEWYLDRKAGRLFYLPRPGESITKFRPIAPVLSHLLRLEGRPEAGRFVEHVTFRGLTFAHSEWWPARDERSASKAAVKVPGAIRGEGVRDCRFEGCTIAHAGNYAIDWAAAAGATHRRAATSTTWAPAASRSASRRSAPRARPAGRTATSSTDCHIHDGGHGFHQAVGVWIGQSSDNRVAHNDIHDFDYTGISVRLDLGLRARPGPGQRHRDNHVHDLGTRHAQRHGRHLHPRPPAAARSSAATSSTTSPPTATAAGASTSTRGRTEIVAEDNLVYRTTHGGFHQHYGRTTSSATTSSPSAATPSSAALASSRTAHSPSSGISCTGSAGRCLDGDWTDVKANFNHNTYWRTEKPGAIDFAGKTWSQWRTRGADAESRIADPRFIAPERADFRLRPDSPAFGLGFKPLAADAGPRKR